jgi:excisionase family DNA binding protein
MTNPFEEITKQLNDLQRQVASARTEQRSEWLNADQAAEFLNLKKSTVYKKTMLREIPFYKHGKKLMFRRPELEGLLLSGRPKEVKQGVTIER